MMAQLLLWKASLLVASRVSLATKVSAPSCMTTLFQAP